MVALRRIDSRAWQPEVMSIEVSRVIPDRPQLTDQIHELDRLHLDHEVQSTGLNVPAYL